jgi:hypothetical protein
VRAQDAWRVHARIVPQGQGGARDRERVPRRRPGAAGGRAVNGHSSNGAAGSGGGARMRAVNEPSFRRATGAAR